MARQAARLRTLAETARLLVATLDPSRIAGIVTARCLEGLDVSDVALYLLDDARARLRLVTMTPVVGPPRHVPWLEPDEGVVGRAVSSLRPVSTPDPLHDPSIRYRPEVRTWLEARDTRALLAVPFAREQTIGAVLVAREVGATFEPDEIEFLSTLTSQTAVALENARLFSLEQRRRAQIETLAGIEREIAAELNPERLLDLIIERASGFLAAEGVIFLLEDDGTLAPRAWYGLGHWIRDCRVPVGEGLSGICALERRGFIVNEYPTSPLARPDCVAHGITRWMTQPLLVRDRLLGVIGLTRGGGSERFTDTDLGAFETFAHQAAIALENARLYREAWRHGEYLEALNVVSRQVASSLQFEEVLRNIATASARFFEAPYCAVWTVDAPARRLRRAAVVGDPELAARFPTELAYGEGAAGWVAEHGAPILWADLEEDRRGLSGGGVMARFGLRYYAAVPMAVGDRLLGVLAMLRATPPPTPEATALVKSLTAQAAVALEHARLYSEATTRLRETQALLEVSQILNSTLEARPLLRTVAIKIAQVCGVDRCTIARSLEGALVPVTSQFADGREEPGLWRRFVRSRVDDPTRLPAHARVIETRTPLIIADTAHTDLIPREWTEAFGARACLLVPIVRQDRPIGIVQLDYCDRPRPFEPSQVNLAMAVAGQLALAMDNARLYAEAQERLREATTLLAVGQALSQPGPSVEGMRRVAREVGRALGADMVGAYAIDPRRDALIPVAGWHVPKDLWEVFVNTPFVLARFPGLSEEWRAGRSAWSSDVKHDPRIDQETFRPLPPHSMMFVPTRVRGESVGTLFLVWWRTGRTFEPAEIRLLDGVGAQVGLAMENAELVRRTEERLRQTELLLEVSRSLTSTLDLPALLRELLRRVQRTIGSDSVGIWLREDGSPWMQPLAGYRVPPDRVDALRGLRISAADHPFYEEAFRTRQPVTSSDAQHDPRLIPALLGPQTLHQSQLFVPIVSKDMVIGGIAAVWWTERREFSESELALMEAVAGQAGAAIENARLFSDNRRRLEELSLLYELSQAVTGQLERDALAETIYRQLRRVLDAPMAGILSYDETRQELEVVLHVRDGEVESGETGRRHPIGEGLASRAIQLRQPFRTDDYLDTCRSEGVTPVEATAPYPCWLGAPMIAGDEVVGAIVLRSSRPFEEADARLLANIAGLAGLAFRSARLYQDRLRAYGELVAAQDHLVRADKLRALGEMASGVAHDFNNLLASIVGRTQMLLERVEEPRWRRWLQVIERAALDGARAVRRLQDFTRIRRDQPFVLVDLNEVVREALEVTRFRWKDDAQSRGVEVEVVTALASVPLISADAAELREALTNLILNGVDAMPEGGTLSLSTRADAEAVLVTIEDTGEGMSEEVKRRLFEPFFTTKGPKGTGLGLSVTFGIVSRHRGQIDVESEPGRGTRFHLRFPMAPGPEAEPPVSPPAVDQGHPLRCLVVDDEEMVRDMLGDVLTQGGHSAVLAGSGGEAIERFAAEAFDLVLTDLGMLSMSGWEVARACKALRPDVPVLLVTGWGVELTSEELAVHGVDAVLAKPVKVDELLAVVASFRRERE
jgi:GAF domain-containing protein/CheY-like chemotaxis protein/anti-sigma regulatory factor (Ser/Thr protein kinase)